jgi:chromosome segregation ATPase
MSRDLKDMIDGIESSESEIAQMQSKVNRLQELIERQKRVITEQENIMEEQKTKISKMHDIPEDVLELKELIGTQRALLTEKETELEHAKGTVAQYQRELELYKQQAIPTQTKLEETFETIGNLKAEAAERKSEILLKTERIKTLENQVKEVQAFADKLQDEQVKLLHDMDQKYKTEIESLKKEHFEEKRELNAKISEMDNILLDSKLISTEATSEAKDVKSRFEEIRNKQEELINKVETLSDEKRKAEEESRRLQKKLDEYQKFYEENLNKINYFDKLVPLMEQEAQFKAFLLVENVGSISIEDLRNAMGSPIVLVKKVVENLEKVDLLEIDEMGKIHVKKVEE